MRRALVIVDVQNDFCEGGSLAVAGGRAVAADVARHVLQSPGDYTLIVATRDYHEDPGDHFASHPDFVKTWPAHCVAGTQGAALCKPILDLVGEKAINSVVDKGRLTAAYSGFEALDADGRPLLDILKEAGIDSLDICGLATDYCVRATALDARRHEFGVRVLSHLCAAVNGETGRHSFEEMRSAGCELTAPGAS